MSAIGKRVKNLVVAVAATAAALLGLALAPYFGVHVPERISDWRRYPDAQKVDRMLEHALVDRSRQSHQSFELRDILDLRFQAACLTSGKSSFKNNPAREMALRSDRPWWWGFDEGASTLVLRFTDNGVRAFRILADRHWLFGGRSIRFAYADESSGATCSSTGRIRFAKLPGNSGDTVRFSVTADLSVGGSFV